MMSDANGCIKYNNLGEYYMKNIKRLSALACTLVLTTGLFAGCGSSNSSSTGSSSDKKVTVDIFQFKVEAKTAFEKAVSEYEADHKNVTINLETVGGGSDYGAALRSKFASGQEPAIFNIGGPQDLKDWQSKLEDLSSEPWIKKAYAGTLDAASVKGKVYGMPFDLEGYGFIYNKTIFQKAGVDASKIKTYADLEAAVKTIDSKKKDLGLDAVFCLPGKETWVTGLHLSNIAFSAEYKDSNDLFAKKTIDFKYSDGLKKLLDIQMNYGYKPDGTNKSINSVDYATQVSKEFGQSKVAIIQQGNWVINDVTTASADLAKNVGILPMPIDGAKEDVLPVGVPNYWCVNKGKDDDTKKAAKDFLNWLYTSEKGKAIIVDDAKFVPALSGYDSDALKPKDALAQDVVKYSTAKKTTPWVFMGYPTGWGQNQLGADIQKYISGDLTWDKVVENAKTNWAAARPQ